MLKTNPNVDLISFFILRTHDNAISLVPTTRFADSRSRPASCSEHSCLVFDLIVLQDVDTAVQHRRLPSRLRSYGRGGGVLAMLVGRGVFHPRSATRTPSPGAPVDLTAPYDAGAILDTHSSCPHRPRPHGPTPFEPRCGLARLTTSRSGSSCRCSLAQPDRRRHGHATVARGHPRLNTPLQADSVIVARGGRSRALSRVTTDTLWRWAFVAAARRSRRPPVHKFLETRFVFDPGSRPAQPPRRLDAVEYAPGQASGSACGCSAALPAARRRRRDPDRHARRRPMRAETVATVPITVGDNGKTLGTTETRWPYRPGCTGRSGPGPSSAGASRRHRTIFPRP